VVVVDTEVVVVDDAVVVLDVVVGPTVVVAERGAELVVVALVVVVGTGEVTVVVVVGDACPDREQPAKSRTQPKSPDQQHDRLYIKRSFGSSPIIRHCQTPCLGRAHLEPI
jgi:hypothetical protein